MSLDTVLKQRAQVVAAAPSSNALEALRGRRQHDGHADLVQKLHRCPLREGNAPLTDAKRDCQRGA